MEASSLEYNWIEKKLEYDEEQYTKLISHLIMLSYKKNLNIEEQLELFKKLMIHLISLANNENCDCSDFQSIHLEDICERLYPNWSDNRKSHSRIQSLSRFLKKYRMELQNDLLNFYKGNRCILIAPKSGSIDSDLNALKQLITQNGKVQEEARKFVSSDSYPFTDVIFKNWAKKVPTTQKALKLRIKRKTHYYRNELKKALPDWNLIHSTRIGRMDNSHLRMMNFLFTLSTSEDNFLLFDKKKNIGWGCYSLKRFAKEDLLLEYKGERLSRKESDSREKEYAVKNEGCYRFCFWHNQQEIVIDPTKQTSHMARYCNHSRNKANAKMKIRVLDEVPRAFLFASEEIAVGKEILWDYGDRDKEATQQNPWLQF